jgi:hypothetical protein
MQLLAQFSLLCEQWDRVCGFGGYDGSPPSVGLTVCVDATQTETAYLLESPFHGIQAVSSKSSLAFDFA